MLIRFNISKSFSSPFISINTQQKNDDLLFMATAIDKIVNQEAVTGYQNEKRKVIPLYQIISVHTESKWSPVNKIDNLNRDFFVLCHD